MSDAALQLIAKSKKEKATVLDLGTYFHDLGIVLWYYSIPFLKSKVILRPCTWEDDFPLSELLALPDKARPVSKWPDEDEAWVAVIEGIRKVIVERR